VDRFHEPLIKDRDAVPASSPNVAAAATLGDESNPTQPLMGLRPDEVPIPNVAAERQRWAGGRYRFAVTLSRRIAESKA